MWVVVIVLVVGYMMIYVEKICKKLESLLIYKLDDYFCFYIKKIFDENKKFMFGYKLILVEMLVVFVWIVWGVI